MQPIGPMGLGQKTPGEPVFRHLKTRHLAPGLVLMIICVSVCVCVCFVSKNRIGVNVHPSLMDVLCCLSVCVCVIVCGKKERGVSAIDY